MPLSGAHVFLLQEADSTMLVSGMADMNGNFTLKVPAGVTSLLLKTTYLGYTDYYTTIQGDTQLEVAMQVADYEIDQVVVKASIFRRKSDRFIFNVSAAPWLHGTDAVALLQHTPLVMITGDDKLSIVGKSKTAIRINGKDPHMSQDAVLAYLRSLPSENIKSIEVITTPGSEYAASYTGGIINIIVKEQTDGLKGSVRLEDSQNKFVNNPGASMNLNFRKRKIAVSANVWGGKSNTVMESISRQTIFENQTDIQGKGRSNQGGGYLGGRIGLDYEITPKHTLGLHFSKSYRALENVGWTNSSYRTENTLDSLMYSYSKGRNPVNQTSASISYLFDIVPSKHKLTMDVSYSNNRRTGNSFTYGERRDEGGMTMYPNTDFIQQVTTAIDAWSGRMDYQWTPTSRSALKSGLSFVTTSSDNDTFFGIAQTGDYVNDPNRTNHFVYDETIGAGYLSYRQEWSDSFETTLGLRGEYMHNRGYQNIGNDRFPTIGSMSFLR